MISILIPSRLQTRPDRADDLWLNRALQSVASQTAARKEPVEVVVGLDDGIPAPDIREWKRLVLRFTNAAADRKRNQASAINAAAAAATGDIIAILEDDDAWRPLFLETAVATLDGFDFVSSSQIVVEANLLPREPMYYATPSGWVMRRTLWNEIGGFNEDIRFHVDMEWLGRLNQAGKKRAHLVESGFPLDLPFLRAHRKWLAHLAENPINPVTLVQHRETVPLVARALSPNSGTDRIRRNADAERISKQEQVALVRRFGTKPW